MQVKFIKNHLKNKAGDVAIVTDERANYFERHKIAVIVKGEQTKPEKPVEVKTPKKPAAKKTATKKSAKKK